VGQGDNGCGGTYMTDHSGLHNWCSKGT